jgi:hypothetical protein
VTGKAALRAGRAGAGIFRSVRASRRVIGLGVAFLAGGCARGAGADRLADPPPRPVLVGGAGEDARPPEPPPTGPGAAPQAKNLDEPLAVVEGTVITRRRLSRALGGKDPETDERVFEERLGTLLRARAVELVLLKAADRGGLRIPPEVLDNAVRKQSAEIVEKTSKTAGRPVTFEEYLANENLTLPEFRERLGNEIVIHHYFESLWKGIPGKRPSLDLDPSPAELRRLYSAHREEFDVPAQVRIAFFVERPVDHLDGGKRLYEEAAAEARRRLEAILSRVKAGETPAQAARAMSMADGDWLSPDKSFERRELEPSTDGSRRLELTQPAGALAEWAFAPGRAVGDGQVFDGMRGTLVGIAVTGQTHPRRRAFEDPEVQEDLVTAIRGIRKQRARITHILELLTTASIHPTYLAEEIDRAARSDLKRLEKDPFARSVWMR